MKGISLWKLVYENMKRKTTLYLDEEYHKIYYLELSYKESKKSKGSTDSLPQSVPGGNYDKVSDAAVSSVYSIEGCWQAMIQYYDIPSYKTELYASWVQNDSVAVVEFDMKYQINLIYDCTLERLPLRVGLPLSKMIQF